MNKLIKFFTYSRTRLTVLTPILYLSKRFYPGGDKLPKIAQGANSVSKTGMESTSSVPHSHPHGSSTTPDVKKIVPPKEVDPSKYPSKTPSTFKEIPKEEKWVTPTVEKYPHLKESAPVSESKEILKPTPDGQAPCPPTMSKNMSAISGASSKPTSGLGFGLYGK